MRPRRVAHHLVLAVLVAGEAQPGPQADVGRVGPADDAGSAQVALEEINSRRQQHPRAPRGDGGRVRGGANVQGPGTAIGEALVEGGRGFRVRLHPPAAEPGDAFRVEDQRKGRRAEELVGQVLPARHEPAVHLVGAAAKIIRLVGIARHRQHARAHAVHAIGQRFELKDVREEGQPALFEQPHSLRRGHHRLGHERSQRRLHRHAGVLKSPVHAVREEGEAVRVRVVVDAVIVPVHRITVGVASEQFTDEV